MTTSILLIKCGDAAEDIRRSAGDYDDWFRGAVRGRDVAFTVLRPYAGEALPRTWGHDAVWVTGSASSVREKAPWMLETAAWLRDAAERGAPILGVCFGHQLLGLAYGSEVTLNPNGRETGSIEISLTPAGCADPLFRGLPETVTVQATHEDVVTGTPRGATVLASNANTALQAFAMGRAVRAVQFHPELSPEGMRAVIGARAQRLEAEGTSVDRLLAGIRPSPAGPTLLFNFLEAFT